MKLTKKFVFVCALLALFATGAGPQGLTLPIQANDSTTGTTLDTLATVNVAGNAIQATTSNTSVPTYIVVGGAGTSGAATLATMGIVPCVMDITQSNTNEDFVVASTITGADCHPQAAAPSPGTWLVGHLISSSTTAGSKALVKIDAYFYSNGGTALYGVPGSVIRTMLGSNFTADPNAINLRMLDGPISLNFSKLLFQINTADATTTDFYDVGIYGPCAVGASCSLICDMGSGSQGVNETTTGTQDVSCTQATPVTLTPPPAGQFFFVATTGNAATAQYASPAGNLNIACARSATTSTSGQLPSAVAIPVGVWTTCPTLVPIIALHN